MNIDLNAMYRMLAVLICQYRQLHINSIGRWSGNRRKGSNRDFKERKKRTE